MSLNWHENAAETERRMFKVVNVTVPETGADGRRTGKQATRFRLLRRVQFNRGGWSRWASCGDYNDIAAAKAGAEGR